MQGVQCLIVYIINVRTFKIVVFYLSPCLLSLFELRILVYHTTFILYLSYPTLCTLNIPLQLVHKPTYTSSRYLSCGNINDTSKYSWVKCYFGYSRRLQNDSWFMTGPVPSDCSKKYHKHFWCHYWG